MKPPVARKLAVGTYVRQPVFWLLVVSSFNYFTMYARSVYKHAVVATFCILLRVVNKLLKEEVGDSALNRHGNYIADHGKSWKNHGIVFLNFCGIPAFICVSAM